MRSGCRSGIYRGELYDIGFDKPETHAIEKAGRMYYAFYAEGWRGRWRCGACRPGPYRVRDYFNDRDLGEVSGAAQLGCSVTFERFLLLEAIPVREARCSQPDDTASRDRRQRDRAGLLVEERRQRIV